MNGPMFIRQPLIGARQGGASLPMLGADIATPSYFELLYNVTEPTLVETIKWVAKLNDTDAGALLVAVSNEEYGSGVYHYEIACEALAAGSAAPGAKASGSVDLMVTIPTGWSLFVAHTVKRSGVYATLDITAHGGVVR